MGLFYFRTAAPVIATAIPVGFNPRRWGFFISGISRQACSSWTKKCFNPRRWGFFISGWKLQVLHHQLYLRVSIPVDGAFLFQVVEVDGGIFANGRFQSP